MIGGCSRPGGLALLLACALTWAAPEAAGQRGTAARLDAAYRLFSDGKLAAARRVLRRTLAATREPALLARANVYLALISAAAGDRAAAEERLRQALRHDPELQLDPEQVKPDVIDLFRRLRDESTGLIAVSSQPPGARVALDGQPVGKSPLERRVLVGAHLVELRDAAGALILSRKIDVTAGQRTEVTAAIAAPPFPTVATSRPASSPVTPPPEIAASRPAAPAQPAAPAALRPERGRRVWTWVALGAAGAALAAAVTLSALAQSAYDDGCAIADPQRERDCRPAAGQRYTVAEAARYASLRDDLADYRRGANVLWGVAGALGVAALVAALLEGRAASESPDRSALRAAVGWRSIRVGLVF